MTLRSLRTSDLTLRQPGSRYGRTQTFGSLFLMAPRVPVRLSAFRPPRGKMNSTGAVRVRQIEDSNQVVVPTAGTGSNLAKRILVQKLKQRQAWFIQGLL